MYVGTRSELVVGVIIGTRIHSAKQLTETFDAVVLSGAELRAICRSLTSWRVSLPWVLPLQNRRVAGDEGVPDLWATGKHVVIIGGGDTALTVLELPTGTRLDR